MTSEPNFLFAIPFLGAPIGYLYTLAISHRGKISKMESEIELLKEQNEKIGTLCEDVAFIKGKIEELVRKSG